MTKRKSKKQKEILQELLRDSNQSCSKIAEKLGMHHNTVKKYISEYEKEQIILGNSCDIAFEKIASTYMVLIRCTPLGKEDYKLLKKRIENEKLNTAKLKVIDSFFTVGEFQNVLLVMCTNVSELQKYLNFLVKHYATFIQSYVVLQVSRTNQRNLHPNLDWRGLMELVEFEEDESSSANEKVLVKED